MLQAGKEFQERVARGIGWEQEKALYQGLWGTKPFESQWKRTKSLVIKSHKDWKRGNRTPWEWKSVGVLALLAGKCKNNLPLL